MTISLNLYPKYTSFINELVYSDIEALYPNNHQINFS
jgi:hypothetical protein